MTGASSGIGSEVARLASRRGARVLAVSRSGGGPRMESGTELVLAAIDVSTRDGVDRTLAQAEECLGGVDIWIANAGFAAYETTDKADWDGLENMFRTNFFSACYAFETLRCKKGETPFRFAVIANAMSYLPLPGYAVYSATKAAVHAYFESARALLRGIERGRPRVYPCKLFRLALALERPASIIWKPYVAIERMRKNRHLGEKK